MSTPRPFDAQLLRVKRAYDRVSGEMAKLALQSTTGLHETATGARVAIAEFRSEVAKLPPLAENAADLDRASKLDYATDRRELGEVARQHGRDAIPRDPLGRL